MMDSLFSRTDSSSMRGGSEEAQPNSTSSSAGASPTMVRLRLSEEELKIEALIIASAHLQQPFEVQHNHERRLLKSVIVKRLQNAQGGDRESLQLVEKVRKSLQDGVWSDFFTKNKKVHDAAFLLAQQRSEKNLPTSFDLPAIEQEIDDLIAMKRLFEKDFPKKLRERTALLVNLLAKNVTDSLTTAQLMQASPPSLIEQLNLLLLLQKHFADSLDQQASSKMMQIVGKITSDWIKRVEMTPSLADKLRLLEPFDPWMQFGQGSLYSLIDSALNKLSELPLNMKQATHLTNELLSLQLFVGEPLLPKETIATSRSLLVNRLLDFCELNFIAFSQEQREKIASLLFKLDDSFGLLSQEEKGRIRTIAEAAFEIELSSLEGLPSQEDFTRDLQRLTPWIRLQGQLSENLQKKLIFMISQEGFENHVASLPEREKIAFLRPLLSLSSENRQQLPATVQSSIQEIFSMNRALEELFQLKQRLQSMVHTHLLLSHEPLLLHLSQGERKKLIELRESRSIFTNLLQSSLRFLDQVEKIHLSSAGWYALADCFQGDTFRTMGESFRAMTLHPSAIDGIAIQPWINSLPMSHPLLKELRERGLLAGRTFIVDQIATTALIAQGLTRIEMPIKEALNHLQKIKDHPYKDLEIILKDAQEALVMMNRTINQAQKDHEYQELLAKKEEKITTLNQTKVASLRFAMNEIRKTLERDLTTHVSEEELKARGEIEEALLHGECRLALEEIKKKIYSSLTQEQFKLLQRFLPLDETHKRQLKSLCEPDRFDYEKIKSLLRHYKG